MAADVTSLVRLLTGYVKENAGSVAEAARPMKERRLDPDQREKLPDFMSLRTAGGLQDLNLPPPTAPLPQLNLLDQPAAAALDLMLRPLAPPPAEYQSVCTLEKVKFALERLHRPDLSRGSTSPASSSTTTSSAKRRPSEDGDGDSTSSPIGPESGGAAAAEMVAAGCPSCLLYVLISQSKPRCPRCNSAVPLPLPAARKKQKIDLNALSSAAIATTTSAPLRTVKFF